MHFLRFVIFSHFEVDFAVWLWKTGKGSIWISSEWAIFRWGFMSNVWRITPREKKLSKLIWNIVFSDEIQTELIRLKICFGLYATYNAPENLKQSSVRYISRALDSNVVSMCEKNKVRSFRIPLGGDLLIWMMRKGKVFICHLVVFTFRLVNPSVIY